MASIFCKFLHGFIFESVEGPFHQVHSISLLKRTCSPFLLGRYILYIVECMLGYIHSGVYVGQYTYIHTVV